jgi:hypothetical protein
MGLAAIKKSGRSMSSGLSNSLDSMAGPLRGRLDVVLASAGTDSIPCTVS